MRLAALRIAIATAVSSPLQTGQQPPTLLEQDAYAVYASALISLRRELPRIALLAETRNNGLGCSAIPAQGWEDVAAAHRQANAQRYVLLASIDLGLPYRLVSTEELAITSDRRTAYVEQRPGDQQPRVPSPLIGYPGGKVYFVSAVGFSADQTRAMFMLQHTCGYDCAGGEQILRVKTGG